MNENRTDLPFLAAKYDAIGVPFKHLLEVVMGKIPGTGWYPIQKNKKDVGLLCFELSKDKETLWVSFLWHDLEWEKHELKEKKRLLERQPLEAVLNAKKTK
ncbi:MAG: hypothetical protein V1494_01125 [Candidatus Diapherotrites archaeon]